MWNRSSWRILHDDLKMHPYKIIMTQECSVQDYANRRARSNEILQRVPIEAVLLSDDEAHFYPSPRLIHEKPLHTPRVTVWFAFSNFGAVFFS